MRKQKNCIKGRFLGYLPYEGICEIKLDNGKIITYSFSPRLAERLRVIHDELTQFLYEPVICQILNFDMPLIDFIEIDPDRW